MLDLLHDPAVTGVVAVTTPEEMPVTETVELLHRLATETGVRASTVIANRVLPSLFDRRQSAVFERLGDALDLLDEAAGSGVGTVVDAARITEARRRIGAGHLDRLRGELPEDTEVLYLPELFTRASGRRVVSLLADALGHELDVDPGADPRSPS
jgi:anion-transporting  ArsA/GET3 family ATPase